MTTKVLKSFKDDMTELEWLEARLEVIEHKLFWYDTDEHCNEQFVKNLMKEKKLVQQKLKLLKK